MRGNAWVGGLIRYIRCKDGHNAANMQKNMQKKLRTEQSGIAPFSFANGGQRIKGTAQPECNLLYVNLIY